MITSVANKKMFRKLKEQLSCIECSSLKAEDIYLASLKQERERMARAHSRPESIRSTDSQSRSSSLPASSRSGHPPYRGHGVPKHSLRSQEVDTAQRYNHHNRHLSVQASSSQSIPERVDHLHDQGTWQQERQGRPHIPQNIAHSQPSEQRQQLYEQQYHHHHHHHQKQKQQLSNQNQERYDIHSQFDELTPPTGEGYHGTPQILRQNPGRRDRRSASNEKRRSVASDPQEMSLNIQTGEFTCRKEREKATEMDTVDLSAVVDNVRHPSLERQHSLPIGQEDQRTRSVSFAGRDQRSKQEPFVRRRANSFSETVGDIIPGIGLSGDGISRSLVSIVNQEWQSQTHLANLGSDSGSASTGSHKQVKSILKNKTNSMDNSHDSHDLRKRVNSVTFADMQQNTPKANVRHSYPINNRRRMAHSHKESSAHSVASGNAMHDGRLQYKPPLPQGSKNPRGLKDTHLKEADGNANITSSIVNSQVKHLWRHPGCLRNDQDRAQSPSPSHQRRNTPRASPTMHDDELDRLPDDGTHASPANQEQIQNKDVLGTQWLLSNERQLPQDTNSKKSPNTSMTQEMECSPQIPTNDKNSFGQGVESNLTLKDQEALKPEESRTYMQAKKRLSRSRLPKSKTQSLPRQLQSEESIDLTLVHRRRMTRSHSLDSDNCSSSVSSGSTSVSSSDTTKSKQRSSFPVKNESIVDKEAKRTTIPKIKKGRSSNHRSRRPLSATRKLERYDSNDSGLCMDNNLSPLMSPSESTDTEAKSGTLHGSLQRSGFIKLQSVLDEESQQNFQRKIPSQDSCQKMPYMSALSEDLDGVIGEIKNEGTIQNEIVTKSQQTQNKKVQMKQQRSTANFPRSTKQTDEPSARSIADNSVVKKSVKLEQSLDTGECESLKSNKLSSIPEYNRGRIRRKSMDNMLNISMVSNTSDETRVETESDERSAPHGDFKSKSDCLADALLCQESPPSQATGMLANESIDWTLSPEDLPTSTIESASQQSLQDFRDIGLSCGDNSIISYMNQNDCSRVIIPIERIRTGRLMMRDEGNTFSICAGSFLIPDQSKRGGPHCKPITVQIYRGLNDKEDRINLLKNTTVLLQLRHQNVQGVYGMCMEGSPYTRDGYEVMVLLERTHYLVTLHKLLTWTSENNPQLMTVGCAVTFGLQMCEGLQFLENQGIIHANLSSHTVRIDPNCNLKIGGVEQFPVSSTAAPIRWMSLETLSSGQVHPKSAVWTFAVILWEILSVGARPYNKLKTGQILSQLSKGHRLHRPEICPEYLHRLMLHCWQPRQEDRPTFSLIAHRLSQYQEQILPSKTPNELFPDREDFWEIVRDHI